MEKNIVYTEPLSASKKEALLMVLAKYPHLEHREIVTKKHADVIPTTYAKIARESYKKVARVWKKIPIPINGNILLGIQKGAIIKGHDGIPPALIAIISITQITDEENATIMVDGITSEEIILPLQIDTLVSQGMHLYDAYGEVFGEDIQTKKVSLA
jgi:hypothetical protein